MGGKAVAKKLYVWRKGVLREYAEGLAVALAENEDEARETLLADIQASRYGSLRTPASTWDGLYGLSQPPDDVVDPEALIVPHCVWLEGSS
jgi:hypothetical protein